MLTTYRIPLDSQTQSLTASQAQPMCGGTASQARPMLIDKARGGSHPAAAPAPLAAD